MFAIGTPPPPSGILPDTIRLVLTVPAAIGGRPKVWWYERPRVRSDVTPPSCLVRVEVGAWGRRRGLGWARQSSGA